MLSVLCTAYNEHQFIDYSIKSYLDFVDNLVITEGAYLETIALGKSPRSTDGTVEICKKFAENEKIFYIEANEKSDPQQRNIGLQKIKEINPDGWLLIIDADEIYDETLIKMVKVAANNLERNNKLAAYFTSLTFVNDGYHFAYQQFPRLFKITKQCQFVNDNFMVWPEYGAEWTGQWVTKLPHIKFWHYSFCKGVGRFNTKAEWWRNRFGKDQFTYSWRVNSEGKIEDPGHKILEYKGKIPEVMRDHYLYRSEK